MNIDARILRILERAQEGTAPSKKDCRELLCFPETSFEASATRAVADSVSRRRFGNGAYLLGQIGIEINACSGRCRFCSFAEGHTTLTPGAMDPAAIVAEARKFTASGELYALFLMTMHEFSFENLVNTVRKLREHMPQRPQLVVNVGDFDRRQAEVLREAGVNGAYHICRLREGVDTALNRDARINTIEAIRTAGLDFYYCCEPIGPEHTPVELVDQMFIGIEFGCFQHAAMRRVCVPGSPLESRGQISELRLAQVTAVVSLASLSCKETMGIGVHEPNLIGLTSGANAVYAEAGSNPRDLFEDTSKNRGRDLKSCKLMLREAGFEYVLASGEPRLLLDTPS